MVLSRQNINKCIGVVPGTTVMAPQLICSAGAVFSVNVAQQQEQ